MLLNNAYGTVVTAADTRNVRMVLVAGVLKKWGDDLVAWDRDRVRATAEASRDRILTEAGVELDVLVQRFGLWDQHFDAAGRRRP